MASYPTTITRSYRNVVSRVTDEELSTSKKPYIRRPDTDLKQDAYLKAYVQTGAITHAATAAGINHHYHYEWLQNDPTYPERFAQAHQKCIETLEVEARRRAIVGVEEPVGWYKGKPGGFVRRYSDVLLIFLLKGAMPEKYRERFEHSGPGGGPIQTQDLSGVPLWLRRAFVNLLDGNHGELPSWLEQAFELVVNGGKLSQELEDRIVKELEVAGGKGSIEVKGRISSKIVVPPVPFMDLDSDNT